MTPPTLPLSLSLKAIPDTGTTDTTVQYSTWLHQRYRERARRHEVYTIGKSICEWKQ